MTQLSPAFRALSARLGQDPLQVQGAGGNTSFKDGAVMWIKASGTALADAETKDIFVAVHHAQAKAEAEGAGDGTCKATVVDPEVTLRPSIETTFHALLDWRIVAHTHSVATIVHAISPEGRRAALDKLSDLPVAMIPYRKPGLPLTQAIAAEITAQTQVLILQNHGLVCAGDSVEDVADLIAEVERRLHLPALTPTLPAPSVAPPQGYVWLTEATAMAQDDRLRSLALGGSYYPDHVVFLGPALTTEPGGVAVLTDTGLALRADATAAQTAMAHCVNDVLCRLPDDWQVVPIGPDAEAELLDWDAEKYRQALAAKASS